MADGITDDIITALARYRWFRVVVRGSAFALRDKPADQPPIGHAALHGQLLLSRKVLLRQILAALTRGPQLVPARN